MLNKLKEFYHENRKLNLISKIDLYFWLFLAGAVSGWVYEEIFYYVTENLLENRGFLFGPYLPVYGVGALLMVLLLERFRKNPIVVFLASIIVTGILEYLTGRMMWQIWHRRWWDYRGLFLNIGGYVCLRSVLTFAVGGLLLIYIVKPVMAHCLFKFSQRTRSIAAALAGAVMIADLTVSLTIQGI